MFSLYIAGLPAAAAPAKAAATAAAGVAPGLVAAGRGPHQRRQAVFLGALRRADVAQPHQLAERGQHRRPQVPHRAAPGPHRPGKVPGTQLFHDTPG